MAVAFDAFFVLSIFLCSKSEDDEKDKHTL